MLFVAVHRLSSLARPALFWLSSPTRHHSLSVVLAMSSCNVDTLRPQDFAHVLWPQEAMSVIRLTNHQEWGAMAVLGTDRGSGVLHVYLLSATMGGCIGGRSCSSRLWGKMAFCMRARGLTGAMPRGLLGAWLSFFNASRDRTWTPHYHSIRLDILIF